MGLMEFHLFKKETFLWGEGHWSCEQAISKVIPGADRYGTISKVILGADRCDVKVRSFQVPTGVMQKEEDRMHGVGFRLCGAWEAYLEGVDGDLREERGRSLKFWEQCPQKAEQVPRLGCV